MDKRQCITNIFKANNINIKLLDSYVDVLYDVLVNKIVHETDDKQLKRYIALCYYCDNRFDNIVDYFVSEIKASKGFETDINEESLNNYVPHRLAEMKRILIKMTEYTKYKEEISLVLDMYMGSSNVSIPFIMTQLIHHIAHDPSSVAQLNIVAFYIKENNLQSALKANKELVQANIFEGYLIIGNYYLSLKKYNMAKKYYMLLTNSNSSSRYKGYTNLAYLYERYYHDNDLAIINYKLAIQNHDEYAMLNLCNLSVQTANNDMLESVKKIPKESEVYHHALITIGRYYRYRFNPKDAEKYLKMAHDVHHDGISEYANFLMFNKTKFDQGKKYLKIAIDKSSTMAYVYTLLHNTDPKIMHECVELLNKHDIHSAGLLAISIGKIPKDKFHDYFKMAIIKNDDNAIFDYAMFNLTNNFVNEALKYFDMAAKLNNSSAMVKLGEHYYKIDQKKSLQYFKDAAKYNHPLAFYNLAKYYKDIKNIRMMFAHYKLSFKYGYQKALIKLGKYYQNNKQPCMALRLYAIGARLSNSDCFRRIGLFHAENDNIKAAEEFLTKAMKLNNSDAMLELGILMKERELNPKLAAKYINDAMILKNINAYIYMAEFLTEHKDYKGAEERYTQALLIDPKHTKLLLSAAKYYHGRDNIGLALKYYTESNCAKGFFELGKICSYRFNDKAKAMEYHKKASNIDPKCDSSYYLGSYYEDEGNIDQMIFYYEKADSDDSLTALGEYFMKKNDYICLQYLTKALDMGSTNAMVLLGNFYRKHKNFTDMIKYYNMAAERDDTDAYYLLGSYYKSIGEHDQALEYFEKSHSYHQIAHYYKKNNKYDDAIIFYTKAADFGRDVAHDLGFCYEQLKDYLEMEKHYLLSFKNPKSRLALGLYYLKIKNNCKNEGILILGNLIKNAELVSKHSMIKYELGQYYESVGNYNKMRIYYEEIIKTHPDIINRLLSYCSDNNKKYNLPKELLHKKSPLLEYMKEHNMMYEIAEYYKAQENIVLAMLYYQSGHKVGNKKCTEALIEYYEEQKDFGNAMKYIATL